MQKVYVIFFLEHLLWLDILNVGMKCIQMIYYTFHSYFKRELLKMIVFQHLKN